MYLDPPYFVAGTQLYPEAMTEADHESLSGALLRRQNWILSYDAHDTIAKLYAFTNIERISLDYSISSQSERRGARQEFMITSPNLVAGEVLV